MLKTKANKSNKDESWLRLGVDIWMIRENLKLSFEERVAQHQDTLNLIEQLRHKAVKKTVLQEPCKI